MPRPADRGCDSDRACVGGFCQLRADGCGVCVTILCGADDDCDPGEGCDVVIDVVVPRLPLGDDSAFVALYARVEGRGFVLLALRFVHDEDGDGLLNDALSPTQPGVVRLLVAPSLSLSGRELFAIAGSQRRDDQRDGHLATDRVSAAVTGPSVVLPAFRTDGAAAVDGLFVVLRPRAGALAVIHGEG